MMISTLLNGWIQRSFITFLLLVAISVRIFMYEESSINLLYALLAFISFFIFLIAATRLPLLTHSSMAILLPNYKQKLKRALIFVWLVGLSPTLLVLPDIVIGAGILSLLILMAIAFVAMIYKPILQMFFWVLFFAPLGFDYFVPELSSRNIMTASAWFLPLVIIFANFCLNKLVNYRGNTKHMSRLISLTNIRMEKTLAVHDALPLHERTKFSQWWSNTNFDYYRQPLNQNEAGKTSSKVLSNKQLIAVCCQGVNSFGISAYLLWTGAIGLLCLVGLYIDESYHQYFTTIMTAIPAMIIGTGTIAVFQIIQNKQSFLARIAITPRFSSANRFTTSFISYVVLNQLTLYVFISLLVGVMSLVFHHISMDTYINLLLMLVLCSLFNFSLMFLGWSAKQDHSNKITWLMITSMTLLLAFAILVKKDEGIYLLFSSGFISAFIMMSVLFGYSIKRYRKLKAT